MKVIYNKYFPIRPFFATNIFGLVLCRGKKGSLSEVDRNHEYIHTLQQREMLFVGFVVWYYIEWLYRAIRMRSFMKGYYATYFEREAYKMERDLGYAKHRKPFGWWHLFVKKDSMLGEVGCFLGDIVGFVREDFRWQKYLFFLLVAVGIIVAQVQFHIYDILIHPSYLDGTSMLRLPMVYIVAYFGVLIPTLFFHGELWRLRQWQVWVLPVILLFIDGGGQGFHAYTSWEDQADIYFKEKVYLKLVASFAFRSVAIVGGLCLFRLFTEGRFGLYGLTRSTKYLRVYLLAFLLLLPVFVVVSTTPQFLSFYPKMAIDVCSGSFGWSDAQLIGIFELFYANDFLGVESMFRGALVVGMGRWLGPRCVIPMAITYMCIHLGKPDLELCSSVIGGYLLGILAYRTKHLWGGIVIHLGIAMLFELLGLVRLLGGV